MIYLLPSYQLITKLSAISYKNREAESKKGQEAGIDRMKSSFTNFSRSCRKR